MKTLFQKDLDKAIDLNMQFFATSEPNGEMLDKINEAEEKAFKKDTNWARNVLDALAIKGEKDKKVYYKIFEQLGFKIVKEVKLELVCYSPSGNVLYSKDNVKNINDVWAFIGYLINENPNAIIFENLKYYSCTTTFEEWVEKVKKDRNIVGKFHPSIVDGRIYTIKLEEEEL